MSPLERVAAHAVAAKGKTFPLEKDLSRFQLRYHGNEVEATSSGKFEDLMTKVSRRIFAAVAGFTCCGRVAAAIIYTDIPDQGVFGALGDSFFEVDLNGDAEVDFIFRSNFAPGEGFVILPQGVNRVFSSPIPMPPDINTFARDFDKGVEIGPDSLGSDLVLVGQRFDTNGREIGAGLLSCALFTQLICLGEFDTEEAENGGDLTDFVGVSLDFNGDTHYGYVEILSSGFNGGTIVSFAYEDERDKPISAGAIPEPTSVFLMCAGGFFFLRRKR